MSSDPHQDKEVVLLPRHKDRRESLLWLTFGVAILIVVVGWVMIVGKQIVGAVDSAKTGIVRVSEIPREFRDTTEPARDEMGEITELIIEGVKPYAEGVKQRQDALNTVSGMVAGTISKEESPIDPEPTVNE